MSRIVLNNCSMSNRFEQILKCNVFLSHFRLSV